MSLNILSETYIKYKTKTDKAVVVQCDVCINDKEMYGDAIYTMALYNFKNGQKPCGCSKVPKRTKEQWTILVKRKAQDNNHTFLGFVEPIIPFGQNIYLNLHCNSCGYNWETTTAGNYMTGRSCPECARYYRAEGKLTSAEVWIERFYKTGQFEGYAFKRQTHHSRLWDIYCPKCGYDKVFQSDRSNLVAGKIPCDCKAGGGINVKQKVYFYLLKLTNDKHWYCGYGITNYPERRIKAHTREVATKGFSLQDIILYTGDGPMLLAFESKLKRTVERVNLQVSGFRREATTIETYDKIHASLLDGGFTQSP